MPRLNSPPSRASATPVTPLGYLLLLAVTIVLVLVSAGLVAVVEKSVGRAKSAPPV